MIERHLLKISKRSIAVFEKYKKSIYIFREEFGMVEYHLDDVDIPVGKYSVGGNIYGGGAIIDVR